MVSKAFLAVAALSTAAAASTSWNTTTPAFDLEDLTLREVGAKETLVSSSQIHHIPHLQTAASNHP